MASPVRSPHDPGRVCVRVFGRPIGFPLVLSVDAGYYGHENGHRG